MMLQVLLYHRLRDIPRTPRTIPDAPKVLAPVALFEVGKFLLQQPRRPSLQSLHQVADGEPRRVFHVHVDVVLAHHPLQNPHVFRFADLDQQLSTSRFDLSHQDLISILRRPHKMYRQSADRMTPRPLLPHLLSLIDALSHEVSERLALKCMA